MKTWFHLWKLLLERCLEEKNIKKWGEVHFLCRDHRFPFSSSNFGQENCWRIEWWSTKCLPRWARPYTWMRGLRASLWMIHSSLSETNAVMLFETKPQEHDNRCSTVRWLLGNTYSVSTISTAPSGKDLLLQQGKRRKKETLKDLKESQTLGGGFKLRKLWVKLDHLPLRIRGDNNNMWRKPRRTDPKNRSQKTKAADAMSRSQLQPCFAQLAPLPKNSHQPWVCRVCITWDYPPVESL